MISVSDLLILTFFYYLCRHLYINSAPKKNKLVAEAETKINVPVSKVWDALTNPDQIKKYFFGTNAISDWKVGSPLEFKGEWEGKEYHDTLI